jgi:uncharacterized membrane protein HdeD (DUF308 family)
MGSGWSLAWRLVKLNSFSLIYLMALASISAVLFYGPAFFLQKLVRYLETDPTRQNRGWGWVYACGLFGISAISYLSELFDSFMLFAKG